MCNAHCNPGSNRHCNAASVANQKHFSPPSRVGRVLTWAHSNVTFLYLLHHWTFKYTLNLLLRGIEPTVARVKGGDITTTLKGLLLGVLCHVHIISLSTFLRLRVFFLIDGTFGLWDWWTIIPTITTYYPQIMISFLYQNKGRVIHLKVSYQIWFFISNNTLQESRVISTSYPFPNMLSFCHMTIIS